MGNEKVLESRLRLAALPPAPCGSDGHFCQIPTGTVRDEEAPAMQAERVRAAILLSVSRSCH